MKKIFTLLFSVVLVSGAFAQYHHHSKDDYPGRDYSDMYGRKGHYENYTRQRDALIAKINFEYDARINAVKYGRGGWFSEKKRTIRRLENERRMQIRMAYARYNGKNINEYSFHDKDRDWK